MNPFIRTLSLLVLPGTFAVLAACDDAAANDASTPPPAPIPHDPDASVMLDAPTTGDAAPDGSMAPSGAFRLVGSEVEACPLGRQACADWPGAGQGVVRKVTSRETFGGTTRERTFHVFVPARHAASSMLAPVLVVLHGGGGSGAQFLGKTSFAELARAEAAGLSWAPNTLLCRASPTVGVTTTYLTPGGQPCEPPAVTVVNARPHVVVFPDGVPDPGTDDTRHWEDGRLPSPGFDTPTPNRDDVGFIDHVLEVVLGTPDLRVDPAQVYLTGVSNGGMMAQRLASEIGPATPHLARISAIAAVVSDLPSPLAPLARSAQPVALALFHGTGIDTPDCNTPACTTPVVAGDGRMPFGVAGGTYFVNSPDRGRVLSGPDTITQWKAALASAGSPTTTSRGVGLFTTVETTTLGTSTVVLESWVTNGGGHSMLSSRQDFHPTARIWSFVSSFTRAPDGTLARRAPEWVTGRY